MRVRWNLVAFSSLGLLLAGSVFSCSPSYTQEQYDALSQVEYSRGKTDGYTEGYDEGRIAGLAELKPELDSTQSELDSTKQKLASTQEELNNTKQMLASAQSELSSTNQTLARTQDRLKAIEEQVVFLAVKVTNLSISPSYVKSAEKVTVSATVTNSGGIQIGYPAILRINGSEAERKSVVLNAGESQVVSFTIGKESTGIYTVELGGLTGTFTVVGTQVIKNLAYITISATGYTDDADPEYEGVDIRIFFYNSQSQLIRFQNIPVTAAIRIYGYEKFSDIADINARYTVYQGQNSIDNDGAGLRIPYSIIGKSRPIYYWVGDVEVTITTPLQGSCKASQRLVRIKP